MSTAPGRMARNLTYRLRLHFPTLALVSGSGVARSGIAWCDPNDHAQEFPIPFAYMHCFAAINHPPAGPCYGFAADTVDAIAYNPPWTYQPGPRLELRDAHGTIFGYFALTAPWNALDLPLGLTFAWAAGYDHKANPFGFAAGLEYALYSSGNTDVQMTKTLTDPSEFIFVAHAGTHVVTEGRADLSLYSGWPSMSFTGYNPSQYADLSTPFNGILTVGAMLAAIGGGLPPFPPRNYTRWRLELSSPNPVVPYAILVRHAEGPVTGDKLQAPDWADSHFHYTAGSPPVVKFYNPAVAGWTGTLTFRMTVW